MTNSDYQDFETFIFASWGVYFNIHRSYYTYISLSPFHQIMFVSLYIDNPQINSPYDPLSVSWRISSVGRASAHHAKGPGFDSTFWQCIHERP